MDDRFAVVFITFPNDREKVESFARTLVNERLAACINVVSGVTSFYTWQGKLEQDTEYLLVIKTRRDLFESLVSRVKELHPYEVPEVVMLPIQKGLPEYLTWVLESTQ